MIANPLIRKAVEVEYALVRTPLAIVESRIPEHSAVRTVLHRGLHGLDGLVAGLLASPDAAPDAMPDPATPRQAPPAPARRAARLEHEREEIAEAIREEQPDVGELADPDLDVADVQAELRAKHIVEEREEQRGRS